MGGAERVVVALARAAQEAGHEVGVASAPGPLAGEIGAAHYALPLVARRPSRIPGAVRALRGAIRRFRPAIVHCHNPGIAAVAALPTQRGRRPPALVSVHGVPDEDYRTAARILRLAGLRVVACGPGVAAALAEHGLRVKATIVNGIAPAPQAADRDALVACWGLDPSRAIVLAVGRLVHVKNHALAVRALAGVPDASLVLVGRGPLADELRHQAEQAGVADRVVLAGLREDARALIGTADAVVLPSRSEGLPLAALETLAAGTPLVATDVRGVRELVADGAALLVPPDDAEALAQALRRVLTDVDVRARLAASGRAVAARYTEDEMCRRYLDLYERLVAGAGR
jgi:glycosyltransferase involved in cell wall biosynthesis